MFVPVAGAFSLFASLVSSAGGLLLLVGALVRSAAEERVLRPLNIGKERKR